MKVTLSSLLLIPLFLASAVFCIDACQQYDGTESLMDARVEFQYEAQPDTSKKIYKGYVWQSSGASTNLEVTFTKNFVHLYASPEPGLPIIDVPRVLVSAVGRKDRIPLSMSQSWWIKVKGENECQHMTGMTLDEVTNLHFYQEY